LQAAALYTGCDNLQSVLDLAIAEFLDRMKREEGFRDTLVSAERAQQRRAGVRRLANEPKADGTRDG
jgi:hypothetical protein